ncbi:MAG: thioredoxin family protein [Myxococcaceae bacterium]
MKRRLFVLTTLSLAALPAWGAEVGQSAPDFTLRDETGAQHSLSQYRGQVVVLEWTNPECPFVQRHYEDKTMQKTLAAFGGKPVVWLVIDSSYFNSPEKSAVWKKQQGFSPPVLQDPSGSVGHAYAAKTTPHMFVVDVQGTLRYAGAIDDDPHGRNPSPVNYVRQAVEAVLAGKPVPVTTSPPYGCSVKYKGNS